MNDEPMSWKIETLRGQLVDLGSAIRQLNRARTTPDRGGG
jgi:hypothetical protein